MCFIVTDVYDMCTLYRNILCALSIRRYMYILANMLQQEIDAGSAHLLRHVYFFCEQRGVQAIAKCFENCDTTALPCHIAHSLIVLLINVSACDGCSLNISFSGSYKNTRIKMLRSLNH